jgi:hypothetical protein
LIDISWIAGKLIKEENVTLEEAKLVDGQSLLIEVRLDDGSWPRDGIKKRKSSGSVKDKLADGSPPRVSILRARARAMKQDTHPLTLWPLRKAR